MGARDTFAWMRAVKQAAHEGKLSTGCLAFCFELVLLIDSATQSSMRSVKDVSIDTLPKPSTIKRYRRQLAEAGLLARGPGWVLNNPTLGVSPQIPGIPTDTPGIPTDTPRVSPQNPSNYYKSTSSSTCTDSTVMVTLEMLPERHRPDTGKRTPDTAFSGDVWHNRYKALRGSPWPWPVWSRAVLPFITNEEREELLEALLGTSDPNIRYAKAIVERMCSGSSKKKHNKASRPGAVPVVIEGRSEDDDAFLRAIS